MPSRYFYKASLLPLDCVHSRSDKPNNTKGFHLPPVHCRQEQYTRYSFHIILTMHNSCGAVSNILGMWVFTDRLGTRRQNGRGSDGVTGKALGGRVGLGHSTT